MQKRPSFETGESSADALKHSQLKVLISLFVALVALTLAIIAYGLHLAEEVSVEFLESVDESRVWRDFDAEAAALGETFLSISSIVSNTASGRRTENLAQLADLHQSFYGRATRLSASLRAKVEWSQSTIPTLLKIVAEARRAEQNVYHSALLILSSADANRVRNDIAPFSASARHILGARFDEAVETLKAMSRPVRVLVVEDNATNLLVVKSVLEKYSITPDVAGNGLEAIEAVRHKTYDVVLMDVHMPEMGGLEATKAIRSLSGAMARVPIVALTANAFANDMAECAAAGMNAHIGKPFRKEELIVVIAQAIQGELGFGGIPVKTADFSTEPLDLKSLAEFREDSGDELLHLLLNTFLSDAANKLERLAALAREPASQATSDEAIRIAHSLKSAGAMAGANALSSTACQLETRLASGSAALQNADADVLRAGLFAYQDKLKDSGLVAYG